MDTSPSDDRGVVRKTSSALGSTTDAEDQENQLPNNNGVMNSREFTDEQNLEPKNGHEPSQKNPEKPIYNEQYEARGVAQNANSYNPEITKKEILTPQDVMMWFAQRHWSGDPFIFSIDPTLLVGYAEQTNQILRTIEEKHKLMLLVGPTGSGKTTMLKWACASLPNNFITMLISKPPASVNEFIDIFNERFKIPWYKKPFSPNIKNLYGLPEFLNKSTKGKHLVVMCDEIHEAKPEILEWLRVLADNVENMSLVVAGLPVFNEIVKEKLETFQKRIITKIELLSLTKKEMREMIQKRIEHVGGTGVSPFNDEVIEYIYDQTGGFPREVLRVCDELLNLTIKLGVDTLTKEKINLDDIYKQDYKRPTKYGPEVDESVVDETEEVQEYRPVSLNVMENMTPLQVRILNMLAEKETSPGEIANMLDLGKYKSRQHAVRSVNNILIRLMQEDFVRRNRRGRTFTYTLSPRIKTLLVRR